MEAVQIHKDQIDPQVVSPFLHPNLADVLGDGLRFLRMDRTGKPIAYFSFYTYSKLGLKYVITPPGMAYCGLHLIFKTEYQAVIDSIGVYLKKHFPSAFIDLRFHPNLSDISAFESHGFEIVERKHAMLNLSESEQVLFNGFSSQRKRNIKAEKKGYEIDLNPNLADAMGLLQHTLAKSANQHMVGFYEAALNGTLPFIKTTMVRLDGKPLAVNLVAHDAHSAYYLLGGFDPEIKDSNAGTLAMWNAIRQAKSAGLKTFDFCGSSIPSISKYFDSFGSEPKPYLGISKGKDWLASIKRIKHKLVK